MIIVALIIYAILITCLLLAVLCGASKDVADLTRCLQQRTMWAQYWQQKYESESSPTLHSPKPVIPAQAGIQTNSQLSTNKGATQ